jgi:uncharacterized protein (TIGR03435 family)
MTRARTSVVLLIALFAAAFAPVLCGQLILPRDGEALPTFEVATVKPSSRDLGRSFHTSIWSNDNTWRTLNTTLRNLIRTAFEAQSPAQLTGGPDALLDSRFDLSAKIGEDDFARMKKLSRDDRSRILDLMVQALLADRFGLKVHVETRELPVFDLVLDKGGSRLQPATPDTSSAAAAAADPHVAPASAPAKPHSQGVSTNINHDQGKMTATDALVSDLAAMLSQRSEVDGRMVIDKTGLTGRYDWTLEWHPLNLNAPDTDATGPSLFSALKSQLGLKLESSKGLVQIVVVDAASSPSPN